MKRNVIGWLFATVMAAVCLPCAQAQTGTNLGDYARQVRKQKAQTVPAAKKFDNDNLPMTDKLSVVGEAPAPAADAGKTETADATPADAAAAGAPKEGGATGAAPQAGQPAQASAPKDELAEKQKQNLGWQKKIQAMQGQIDSLNHEIDITNREYRLRAAAFYADAGNRLRNSTAWDKEDAQYKEQIAAKEKQLDDAKKQLEDMQEQARRAGVPSSMRE
jgi:hypothetical protein